LTLTFNNGRLILVTIKIAREKIMKIAIRYYSETGNTEKLANAISKVTEAKALSIDNPLDENVDILFLGSSVYYSSAPKKIKTFIKNINVKVGTVVNFSTASIMRGTYNSVKRQVIAKNIDMSTREFHCKGSWGAFYEARPNDKDLNNCREFAKQILLEQESKTIKES